MLWLAAVTIVLLLVVGIAWRSLAPVVPAQLEARREPRLATLPALKVLCADGKGGTAQEISAATIGKLFKAYFKLPGAPRRLSGAPRARWARQPDGSLSAHFALPVPEGAGPLPAGAPEGVALGSWDYGEVAEILHVGRYDAETPSVEKLRAFMAKAGVKPAPDEHEEEYVRGPGMFGPGRPERYLTILRYRVSR